MPVSGARTVLGGQSSPGCSSGPYKERISGTEPRPTVTTGLHQGGNGPLPHFPQRLVAGLSVRSA